MVDLIHGLEGQLLRRFYGCIVSGSDVHNSTQVTQRREWLVENKYAAKGKIAINGGSNGGVLVLLQSLIFISRVNYLTTTTTTTIGLLVSACVNRAPEGLLGAAVAEVGVHDLLKVLRFHPISIAKSNIHCPFS